ncbi:MAG: hypothetical protein KDE58_32835, partial [Caldilineaceae bacterium]|nr:hypothetical protein [Caldilineaceae bacterium]
MTNPPDSNKSALDQLYADGILTEEAYQAALARLHAQQVTATERGIAIGGSVTDSPLITGDNNRIVHGTNIEHQTVNPPLPNPADAAHTRYLERLCLQHNVVPLAALGEDEEVGDVVKLEQVYIALDTTTQVATKNGQQTERFEFAGAMLRPEGKSRALTALEATVGWKKLALLGDPGSGKSTFVRQL